MNKITKHFITLSITLSIFALLLSTGVMSFKTQNANADSINTNYIMKMSTSTAVAVQTSSTLLLATSTSRSYAIFSNDSGHAVYLALNNGLPATLDSGILLNASSTYEIRDLNNYIGAVYAISAGAASNVLVTEAH